MQPSLSAGVTLQNRYRLLGILGQGGFGRTYLGEDLGRFNERCAIKEFIPLQTGDSAMAKSRELFRREAEILYQISHPQIPQFRATFEENQRLFIVQDYVAGKTYRELLNERQSQGMAFSESEGLQLLRQLLPVLAHIHARGIIHRDIAPDNIILRQSDYQPVLIDFGVVKAIATQIQLQGSTGQSNVTTVGKLGYAPSEQMQTGRAYPNSDLYALAVTVVVLMTGHEPQDLYDDISLTWHWQRYVQVNPNFAGILNKMLSYRPGDRYQSVAEVAKALQDIGASPIGQTAAPPTAPATYPAAVPQHTLPPLPNPAAQAPDLSHMQTVAVGRRAVPSPTGMDPNASRSRRAAYPQTAQVPGVQTQRSMWDNPLSVIGMGLGLALITGIASWAVVSALMNLQASRPDPTPTVTATPTVIPTASATPSPSPTDSPSPDDEPVVFDQRVNLEADSRSTLRGTLRANQAINYIVSLDAGDSLAALLEADNMVMSVLDANQDPLDGPTVDVTRWQDTVNEAGDYILQLRPTGNADRVDYALNLRREATIPNPPPDEPDEPDEPDDPSPSPDPDVSQETISVSPGSSTEVTGQVQSDRIQRYLVALSPGQVLKVDVLQGDVSINLREPAGQSTGQVSGSSGQVEAATRGYYQIDVSGNQVVNFALRVEVQ
ncbi:MULTISPECIES: serine/threonine-protein kinase [unclassified Leptolyngbya]|uniref:serine/threonine-protein kinase n=1 Tax=unclassified Leptolyngbya TaxID=2650499 RepID=UPI001683261B|nr:MULTISPECIES: serine/threonine-protein kinase [unclassified Leptolyngbya]MBD1914133.1 serine/threonine protein kinase [Leptolyngbya sp. FACHB-8]MBD2155917.1 serine/threonine protein kinase [Leptolyngbya sp. FACHB-16]